MVDYRIYILANKDEVTRRIRIECADDDEAIAVARQHIDGRDVEVWQGDRRILRLDRPWKEK